MPSGPPRRVLPALLGLVAFAAAVAWFGIVKLHRQPEAASPPLMDQAEATPSKKKPEQAPDVAPPAPQLAEGRAETKPGQPAEGAAAAPPLQAKSAPLVEPGKVNGPTFDVVRVEPNGETVIAGRGPPGATIEMLRNGKSHARAIADTSGLFAFVPPPLRPGSHEIALSSVAPDGSRAQSRDSVTVVINEDRTTKPLVTLTSPDRPTVVLSEPDARTVNPAAATDSPGLSDLPSAAVTSSPAQPSANGGPQPPAPRPGVRIASVEAEEGGRLFVSGQAAPGATVRLYLNESFIAPGGTGNDGKVSFAIRQGVRPGDYRVRLDDIDPVSGQVKSRAEVAFNVPVPLTVPLPPHTPPVLPGGDLSDRAVAEGSGPSAGPFAGSATSPAERRAAALEKPANESGSGAGTASMSPGAVRSMDPGTIVVPEINTAMVARGDNLWRISRRIYGQGTRYTVIYDANQAQIRTPDRIYPGQIFVLPPDQSQPPH